MKIVFFVAKNEMEYEAFAGDSVRHEPETEESWETLPPQDIFSDTSRNVRLTTLCSQEGYRLIAVLDPAKDDVANVAFTIRSDEEKNPSEDAKEANEYVRPFLNAYKNYIETQKFPKTEIFLFIHWGGGYAEELERLFNEKKSLLEGPDLKAIKTFAISSRRRASRSRELDVSVFPIRVPQNEDDLNNLISRFSN